MEGFKQTFPLRCPYRKQGGTCSHNKAGRINSVSHRVECIYKNESRCPVFRNWMKKVIDIDKEILREKRQKDLISK